MEIVFQFFKYVAESYGTTFAMALLLVIAI